MNEFSSNNSAIPVSEAREGDSVPWFKTVKGIAGIVAFSLVLMTGSGYMIYKMQDSKSSSSLPSNTKSTEVNSTPAVLDAGAGNVITEPVSKGTGSPEVISSAGVTGIGSDDSNNVSSTEVTNSPQPPIIRTETVLTETRQNEPQGQQTPLSGAQSNETNEPQQTLTVSEPHQDLSQGQQDLSISQQDISTSQQDLPIPQQNLSQGQQDISTSHQDLTSEPQQDLSQGQESPLPAAQPILSTEQLQNPPLTEPQQDLSISHQSTQSNVSQTQEIPVQESRNNESQVEDSQLQNDDSNAAGEPFELTQDEIFFSSTVEGSKEKKIMSVRSDGTKLTTWDMIENFTEPFFVTEDNKTLFYLSPESNAIFSVDLPLREEAVPVKVYDGQAAGKKILEFIVNSDGSLIMMRTLWEMDHKMYIKIIGKDTDKWNEWKNPINFRYKGKIGFEVISMIPDKDSIVFAKKNQLCEAGYLDFSNEIRCSDLSNIGKIYGISPDAKLFLYARKITRSFAVADVESKAVLCNFRIESYEKFIVHKWVQDGVYVSFREKDAEFSRLYKIKFADGTCTPIENVKINVKGNKTKSFRIGKERRMEFGRDEIISGYENISDSSPVPSTIKVSYNSSTEMDRSNDIFFSAGESEDSWKIYSYSPITRGITSWFTTPDKNLISSVAEEGNVLAYYNSEDPRIMFFDLTTGDLAKVPYNFNNLDFTDISTSPDGESVVLHGVLESNRHNLIIELLIVIEFDQFSRTWNRKMNYTVSTEQYLEFPTLTVDKQTVIYACKTETGQPAICRIEVANPYGSNNIKPVEAMGITDSIVKISPDAKYFAYTKNNSSKLIIATTEDHRVVSEFNITNRLVIHRWINDSIYASDLFREKNKMVLMKLTYSEGNVNGETQVLKDVDNETVTITDL